MVEVLVDVEVIHNVFPGQASIPGEPRAELVLVNLQPLSLRAEVACTAVVAVSRVCSVTAVVRRL